MMRIGVDDGGSRESPESDGKGLYAGAPALYAVGIDAFGVPCLLFCTNFCCKSYVLY